MKNQTPMRPFTPVYLGTSVLNLVTKTKLLGLTVEQKLTWVANVLETKRTFFNKLDLLKRSCFLPRGILKDFYFKVILPAVRYSLVLWGLCRNSDLFNSIDQRIWLLMKSLGVFSGQPFFVRLIASLYLIHCPRLFVKTALTLILLEGRTVSSYQGTRLIFMEFC